jgi:hypothetical protein
MRVVIDWAFGGVITKRSRMDPGTNHRGSNEELVVAEIGQVGTQFDTFSHQMIGTSMYNCFRLDEIMLVCEWHSFVGEHEGGRARRKTSERVRPDR